MAPERVLVRLPNWLGDVIMARPLLAAVRGGWPGSRVLAVGPAGPGAIVRDEGLVAEVAPWSSDPATRSDAAARARAWRPDVALVLPGSFSSAYLAWRSGARARAGYRGEGRSPLLTHALPRRQRGERHLSDEFLDLGAALGLQVPRPCLPPRLLPVAAGRDEAERLLAEAGVGGDERLVLFGTRSAYGPAREWFPARFAEAGRALAARGCRVILSGTVSESESATALAGAIGPGALSLAGRTSLPGLVALAARAALAICNDSGLAHVAAAAGTPTIQIYGSAASGWTAARGRAVRILHRAPVCSPCWRRHCVIGTRCLAAITVASVLRHAEELLAAA